MRVFNGLLILVSLIFFVGCGGAGDAAGTGGDENVASDAGGGTTPTGSGNNGGTTPPNPNPNPAPNPQPTGPQPGEIVAASTPAPNATYPATGQPLQPQRDGASEPNTDFEAPIIEIKDQPNAYIPSDNGTIQLAAADNVGGSGLKDIQCSIDDGAWTSCSEQVNMTGLSEGVHTLTARAEDWDNNQSTEVSYVFYVDQTPPAVQIANAPTAMTTSANADFQFQSSDDGSGVAYYECRIDTGAISRCDSNEAFQNVQEGNRALYVRAVDNVGNRSANTVHHWTVDNSAPVINVTKQPSATVYIDDPDPVVHFTVADTYSPNGITTTCKLNGAAYNCAPGTNITIPASQPANFVFEITATDALGNASSTTVSWNAVNEAENRNTTITVNDVKPVDILFVVDNSGSMSAERANLAERIDGMINIIDGLDWQIGVISTDATNNDNKSDGKLIEMRGMAGTYILDSSMDVNTAQSVFGDTVQNFGGGSGNEEGIYSAARLIDRYVAGENHPMNFFRDGADLSIVVLSDEDESSNGNGSRITPQGFLDHVTASFNNKNVVWHSIIYKPGDSTCTSGANEGNYYDALSRLTGYGQAGGAIIGSVCSQDYTSQLQDIGQSVKDLRNSIQLECPPFDADKDGNPDITVMSRADANANYAPYNAPYTIQGKRVIFQDLLPAADYKVDYKCKVN